MHKSPFKFLDSFTLDDREVFFGRDRETGELYTRVFQSKLLVVYGTSGTGKTSLINCGLASKFNDSDWMPVYIRRGTNINRSILEALSKLALSKQPFEKALASPDLKYSLDKFLHSIYLDHFKPVFLILDQFEEIFIFGTREEREELTRNISRVLDSEVNCRFIFSIREEYLAGFTEFEKIIPSFLANRIRIEKMTRSNAVQAIEGPCRIHDIHVEKGFAENLLSRLNPESQDIELTWLQVYLDKIFKLADSGKTPQLEFSNEIIGQTGDVKDLLGDFLEEQISQLDDPEAGTLVLKSLVSVKGTRHQKTEEEITEFCKTLGKELPRLLVRELINRFTRLRILRDKDESNRYELRHDSLATKIYEKITLVEKELLEIRLFLDNAYATFEKRGLHLSAEDLKYIAPYEDKLFLNDRLQKFISGSKRLIQRAKHRRQNILVISASILIAVLSFFTIWALRERGNAIDQKRIADEQRNDAIAARLRADSASAAAKASMHLALEKENLAVSAHKLAEERRMQAWEEREFALRQKNIADQLSAEAGRQAQRANDEKAKAEQERSKAVIAEAEAKRLGLLSKAQNIALKSMNMMEWTAALNGLLAVQAFNLNIDNGGSINDPVIFESLFKSWTVLDKSRHQLFRNSPNEIRSITEREGKLLTADLDGIVRTWTSDGKNNVETVLSVSGPVDFIRFSPSGKYLLYGRENSSVFLKDLLSDSKTEILLNDNSALIMSAAFSGNEKNLAVATTDTLVTIWDISASEPDAISSFKLESPANCIEFLSSDTLVSAFGYRIDNASIGNYIYKLRWTSLSGKTITEFSQDQQKPVCLKFNSREMKLYVGLSHGHVVRMSGPERFEESESFILGYSGIDNITFSSDGTLAAFSCWDKSIKIIDFRKYFLDRDQVGGSIHFKNLGSSSGTMIFDSSNKLISAMSDRTMRIWETSPFKICSAICQLAGRDITRAEWAEHIGDDIQYRKTCESAVGKSRER